MRLGGVVAVVVCVVVGGSRFNMCLGLVSVFEYEMDYLILWLQPRE